MDNMDEKHKMIQMLLGMLKSSASKEVSDGMKPPADAKGLSVEKVSVIPHKMADGGMPAASDEPGELHSMPEQSADGSADAEAVANLPGSIEDEGKEKDEMQALHNENIMDEDEDNNQSAFQAFLPRKKKK